MLSKIVLRKLVGLCCLLVRDYLVSSTSLEHGKKTKLHRNYQNSNPAIFTHHPKPIPHQNPYPPQHPSSKKSCIHSPPLHLTNPSQNNNR